MRSERARIPTSRTSIPALHNGELCPLPCLDCLAAVLEALESVGGGDGARRWERIRGAADALGDALEADATSDADVAEVLCALGARCSELQARLSGKLPWTTVIGTASLADNAWACRGPRALGGALDRVGLQLGGLAAAALAAQTEHVGWHIRRIRAAAPSGRDACSIGDLFSALQLLASFAYRLTFGMQLVSGKRFVPALRATCCKPALITDALRAIRDALRLTAELAGSWEERHLLVASDAGYRVATQSVALAVKLWRKAGADAPLFRPEADAAKADAALQWQLQHAALLCTWRLLQSPAPADARWFAELESHVTLLTSPEARVVWVAACDAGRLDREAAAVISQHQAVAAAAAGWVQQLNNGVARLRCDALAQLAMLCWASAPALMVWQHHVPPADLAAWTADMLTAAVYVAQEVAAALGGMQPEQEQQFDFLQLLSAMQSLAICLEQTMYQLATGALQPGSRVPVRLAAAMLAGSEAFLRLRAQAQRLRSAALRASDGASSPQWASAVLKAMQWLPTQALGGGVQLACVQRCCELDALASSEEPARFLRQHHATALAVGRSVHTAAAEAPANGIERRMYENLLTFAVAVTARAFEATSSLDERRLLLSAVLALDAAGARLLGQGNAPCQRLAAVLSWSDGSGDSTALQRARALALRRSCANLACTSLAGRSEAECKGRLCSGCKALRFCCKACSKEAWHAGGHKATCALLAAERRDEEG